jgi:hypothetical protein
MTIVQDKLPYCWFTKLSIAIVQFDLFEEVMLAYIQQQEPKMVEFYCYHLLNSKT